MKSLHCGNYRTAKTRREFLQTSSLGFGAVALGWMLERERMFSAGRAASLLNPLAPKQAHFPAKAKSVIFIFMQGGLSQVDSFDPKPLLTRLDGQPLPDSFNSGMLNLQFIKGSEAKMMASRQPFQRYGESGLEVSDYFPHLGQHADDLAVIRSCYHDSFIHGPALSLLHSGSIRLGSPSMGSWILYGLGSETDNLPSYIVMTDKYLRSGKALISSGFLPAVYQGTVVSTEGVPFENLAPPPQIEPPRQRLILNQIRQWNRAHLERRADDSRLEAQINNYELAFRMQVAASELIDLAKEPTNIRKMYGLEEKTTEKFGRMCLLARRMVERGVRFVHLYSSDWDGHAECDKNHTENAQKVDRPIGALLADLKQRGLLESTLIVSSGEFGRTPVMQGKDGRDHNPYGFSAWMAGGGIRGGKVIGATDELGFRAVEDKVAAHDLHATMLELLGLDHHKLTYFLQGLERRLTGVGEEGRSIASRLVAG